MRPRRRSLWAVWLLSLWLVNSVGAQVATVTLQNAQSSCTPTATSTAATCTNMPVGGFSVVGVSVLGTAGADRVVTFKGSVDGTNFATVQCTNSSSAATGTSVTVSGTTLTQWRCPVSGFSLFQTTVTGGATGTVTVTGSGLDRSPF